MRILSQNVRFCWKIGLDIRDSVERVQGSFDYVAARFAPVHSAQDDNSLSFIRDSRLGLTSRAHIPGSFIPASLRAKLGFPISLNIFLICTYCLRRLFTSCTVVPDPRAIRLRRLPLITS